MTAPRAEPGGNYFREVIIELRKVVWPTWGELRRMTGIVIVTVLIFAAIIGLADLLLSVAVKQLYVQPGTTTVQNFQNQQVPPVQNPSVQTTFHAQPSARASAAPPSAAAPSAAAPSAAAPASTP